MKRVIIGLLLVAAVGCSNDPVARCKGAKERVAKLQAQRSSAYSRMNNTMYMPDRMSAKREFDAKTNSLVYAEQDMRKYCSGR